VKRNEHDALQLEVSTIGDREWFSWPGRENAFVEDPAALVGFGLMTSGQLTSTLKTVFLDGFARWQFRSNATYFSRSFAICIRLWGGPPGPRGSPWTRS
jgi:hypothetical protein